ncbi:hypothetical protein ACPZ19_30845 [Amycolatopsis lurida]
MAKKFGKRGKKKGAPEDPRNMFGPPMPRRGGPPASSTPLADFLDRAPLPGVDEGYVVLPRSLAEGMSLPWQQQTVELLSQFHGTHRGLSWPIYRVTPSRYERLVDLDEEQLAEAGYLVEIDMDGDLVYRERSGRRVENPESTTVLVATLDPIVRQRPPSRPRQEPPAGGASRAPVPMNLPPAPVWRTTPAKPDASAAPPLPIPERSKNVAPAPTREAGPTATSPDSPAAAQPPAAPAPVAQPSDAHSPAAQPPGAQPSAAQSPAAQPSSAQPSGAQLSAAEAPATQTSAGQHPAAHPPVAQPSAAPAPAAPTRPTAPTPPTSPAASPTPPESAAPPASAEPQTPPAATGQPGTSATPPETPAATEPPPVQVPPAAQSPVGSAQGDNQAGPEAAPPLPIGFSQPEPWNPPLAPGETAASTSGQLPVVPPPTAKPVTDLDEPFAVPSAQEAQESNPDDTDTPPRGLRLPVNDRGWFDELPDSASAASSSEPPQAEETTFGPSGDPTEIPYRYRK